MRAWLQAGGLLGPDGASQGELARFLGTFVPDQSSNLSETRRQEAPDFGNLVNLHYGNLYRFALSLTHSESDASDLVQETFAIWGAKGHQLRDASKAKTWLFTTMHRLFLETHRRAVRFPEVEITAMQPELPNVDPDLVSRLDGQTVVELLQRVTPAFQAPVALFYLEDLSYNEIAETLGVPLGTVKSRIARGLAELKELMRRLPSGPAGKEAP